MCLERLARLVVPRALWTGVLFILVHDLLMLAEVESCRVAPATGAVNCVANQLLCNGSTHLKHLDEMAGGGVIQQLISLTYRCPAQRIPRM